MAKEPTTPKAEDVVFGDGKAETITPSGAIQEAGLESRKIEVDESTMKELLNRLNTLEADKARSKSVTEDDIFNPLKMTVTERTLKIAYYNDKLVVGYVAKQRPDGTKLFITNETIETGEFKGSIRGMVVLLYQDGTTEKVDHVRFLTEASCVVVPIKSQKDIGELVEQGEVTHMQFNGRTLVPTATRVMTGYKEQKFIYTVEHQGEMIEVSQDVVNIK